MNWFLTTHQHNEAIQFHTRWRLRKIQTVDKLRLQKIHKFNTKSEKANDAKYSKTKLPWFSRLLRHLARKREAYSKTLSKTTQGENQFVWRNPGLYTGFIANWKDRIQGLLKDLKLQFSSNKSIDKKTSYSRCDHNHMTFKTVSQNVNKQIICNTQWKVF